MKNTKSKSKKPEGLSDQKGRGESPKTIREGKKFPYLQKELNTKRRRDYQDNLYYINGVKSVDTTNPELGIRALNEAEKEWMNQFNKEYYSASFEENDDLNLHQNTAPEGEIQAIRDFLSELKAEAREEKDKDLLRELYADIDHYTELLCEMYPKKRCTDANNARNRCLLNRGKATNEVKFIPWEGLDQNTIGQLDVELLYILNDMEKDEDKD